MLNFKRAELRVLDNKKFNRQLVEDWLVDAGQNALFADGFDDAIIGVSMDNPKEGARVIYDYAKCIEKLEEDMSHEDAIEYFSFNVSGAWVGEKTPIFVVTGSFIEDYS